jgi:hypothetical protein
VEKDLPALYFPTETRRVQQWPAGGADWETEIRFTSGATHRNEGENTGAQKIKRHATIQLEPSANKLRMSILVQNTMERAMGIEQIRMNQTKALPPVPQSNWSQMESD